MIRYIGERFIIMIFLLFGISIISFLIMQLAPGNYLDTLALNPQISPAYIEQMRQKFGLNLPWYAQYFRWIGGILPHRVGNDWKHWDCLYFGISFSEQIPVFEILKPAMVNTFILATLALLVSWGLAIPLGVLSSVKQNGYFDQAAVLFAYVGFAIPDFFLALILLFLAARVRLIPLSAMASSIGIGSILLGVMGGLFSWKSGERWVANVPRLFGGVLLTGIGSFFLLLGLSSIFQKANLPIGGMSGIGYEYLSPWGKLVDLFRHLFLPTLVLAVGNVAYLMRQMRASMLDVLRSEYITTARAKGVSESRVIGKHAFRNALNPMITLLGFEFGFLLSGALAVEIVMSWPGLGRVIYEAIIKKDLYVVMGDLMLSSFLLIVGNLVADVLLALSDPRIRYSR